MKPNLSQLCLALLLSALVLRPSTLFAQGPLNPPAGPPAPNMKSLGEIEPRNNLQASPAPAGVDTTNAAWHFIINQPGSYYLSANLGVTKTHGIQINAEGVTLDLNGFQIARTSGSGGNGIEIPPTSDRASIRQGSIIGFNNGIESLYDASYACGCSFRDLAVSRCTGKGIHAGEGAVLESCRAHDNSGNDAIRAERGSSLTNCTASNNTTANGIFANVGSSLSNCSASGNTGTHGIRANASSALTNCSASFNTVAFGIWADVGSTVTHCTASNNVSADSASAGIYAAPGCTVSHSTAAGNSSNAPSTSTTGMGFWITQDGMIQNCTASTNEGDGIRITFRVVARDNSCTANGADGDGAGVHSTNIHNRIEGNSVTENDRGIDVDAAASLIIRNSASDNTTNYQIVAGNKVGGIVSAPDSVAINGSTGGAGVGSVSPWSNFSF